MKKLLAILTVIAMAMSMVVVVNAAFDEAVEIGLYVGNPDNGGWGSRAAVTVPGPGDYTIEYTADSALALAWIMVKNTAGETAETTVPAGSTVTITDVTVDGTSIALKNDAFVKTIAEGGAIEVIPYLTFAGTNEFADEVPAEGTTFSVTFTVDADLSTEEPETPAVPEHDPMAIIYDFEDGVVPTNFEQHWGAKQFTVVDGALFVERAEEQNSYFAAGFPVGTLYAGSTYTVSVDIWFSDAEYGNTNLYAALTQDNFDGAAYKSDEEVLATDTKATLTFVYTPAETLSNVWFTTKQNVWNGQGVDYYLDNISITEELPEPVIPPEEVPEFIDQFVTIPLVADGESLSTDYNAESGKAGWGTRLFQGLSGDAKSAFAAADGKLTINYTIEGNGLTTETTDPNTGEPTQITDYGWWNFIQINLTMGETSELTVPNWSGDLAGLITHTFNGNAADQWTLNQNGEHTVVIDIPALAAYYEAQKGASLYANFSHFGTQTGFPVETAVIRFTSIDLSGTIQVKNPDYVPPRAPVSGLGNGGYVVTGDEFHALIGNGIIITTPHVFDANNVCIYCGHYVEPVATEEEVIVEIVDPVESTTEEEEDVTVEVEEPAEDTNPGTGLALAVIPMLLAAAAVVISKK